ncbi:MAG: hypothetical protein KatS3mg105_2174 [Gemmatales bacterium]|nr:MAG: hypothetical protein KatS3mg105_2174 [Gemmatales bacterium]
MISVHTADKPIGNRWVEIGGEQKRVAHGQRPVSGFALIAIAHGRKRKGLAFFLGQQLDQGHIPDTVEADEHGIIKHAVCQTTLHDRSRGINDVKVGEGIAFFVDDDSGTAPLAAASKDRHH